MSDWMTIYCLSSFAILLFLIIQLFLLVRDYGECLHLSHFITWRSLCSAQKKEGPHTPSCWTRTDFTAVNWTSPASFARIPKGILFKLISMPFA